MKLSGTKLAKILTASTFLQLLVLIVVADAFITPSLPKVALMIKPDLISSNSLRLKIRDYLGKPENPDVVIMGSSLVIAPAIHCDAAMLPSGDPEKVRIRKTQTVSYTRSKYFEDLLRDKSSSPDLSIYNLGLPGSMVADSYTLFEEMLSAKKRPSLIVLGIAARDFVNCKRVDPLKSKLLDEVRQFHKLRNFTIVEHIRDLPISIREHIDTAKEDLAVVKSLANSKVCAWRQKGVEPQTEQILQEVQLPTKESLNLDRSMYSECFTGATAEGVRKQLGYLDRILKLANQEKIPVVIVNMPVTAKHKELLTTELSSIYQNGVKEVATRNGCTFVDMDSPGKFDAETDFRDSLHLNAKGGRQFYQELAASIADSRILKESIASTQKVTH